MAYYKLYNEYDISALRDFILENGNDMTLAKNEYFSVTGSSPNRVGLVMSGSLAMCALNSKGQRSILSVAFEDEFISNYLAYQVGKNCNYDIQALENSVVRVVEAADVIEFLKSISPETPYRFITGIAYALMCRMITLRCKSPRERYLELLGRVPDLHQKCSMTVISSYLGISREAFQRMKRDIDREDLKSC